jgi:hypothetical protein
MNIELTARGKVILSLILFITLCVIGYCGYLHLHTKPITSESQAQAETPQGVGLAAQNAKVAMMQDQLDEAAKQIALLKNKQPDTIIQTVPYEVEKVVIKEVEKNGANFAIVTDPKNPDKKVDLKEIAKLPADAPVTLNQYNVFAYKKVIRGVNIYPSFTGIKPSGVSEVTYDVSRKVTNDGKYIGVVGGYNFDDKKAKIGLRITF